MAFSINAKDIFQFLGEFKRIGQLYAVLCQHIIVGRDSEIAPTEYEKSRFGDRSYRIYVNLFTKFIIMNGAMVIEGM